MKNKLKQNKEKNKNVNAPSIKPTTIILLLIIITRYLINKPIFWLHFGVCPLRSVL